MTTCRLPSSAPEAWASGDAETAISIPGVKLVAACDLYDGRLDYAKRNSGNDIFTTKDYREIIARKDIDAVIYSHA